MVESLLSVNRLVTGYDKRRVIDGVSLHVGAGEIVAIIGHNGAGKSTLLKAIYGLLPSWEGQIEFNGRRIENLDMRARLRMGLVYVPQGNRVFTDLTVRENLELASEALVVDKFGQRRAVLDVIEAFPVLGERLTQRARNLSGGERQMLALASALIGDPFLLLLDEPSLGLVPELVLQVFHRIVDIKDKTGRSFLIVEQKVRDVLQIADRVYVLRNGLVSYSGSAAELRDEEALKSVYL